LKFVFSACGEVELGVDSVRLPYVENQRMVFQFFVEVTGCLVVLALFYAVPLVDFWGGPWSA